MMSLFHRYKLPTELGMIVLLGVLPLHAAPGWSREPLTATSGGMISAEDGDPPWRDLTLYYSWDFETDPGWAISGGDWRWGPGVGACDDPFGARGCGDVILEPFLTGLPATEKRVNAWLPFGR